MFKLWVVVMLLCCSLVGGGETKPQAHIGQELVSAAVSPDGCWVAGLSRPNPEAWLLTLWDSGNGEIAWQTRGIGQPVGTTFPLAWSSDSQWIALGNGGQVELIRREDGSTRPLEASAPVREVRFTGPWLMARAQDSVYVWETATAKILRYVYQPHLLAAAVSHPSGLVAAASVGEPIHVYQLSDGQFLRSLPSAGACTGLRFVHQGQWLAAGFRFNQRRNQDQVALFVWERATESPKVVTQPNLVSFDVSEDGLRLVTRGPGGCTTWDLPSGRRLFERVAPGFTADSISPDGRQVATFQEREGLIEVWDSENGAPLLRIEQKIPPTSFQFFAPGALQVLDGALSIWKVGRQI